MGFSSKKNYCWLQNQKIRGKVCNRGIQIVVHEHFQTWIKRYKHTRGEKRNRGIRHRDSLWSRAGIWSIFGNTCVHKLPVRHIYANCSWGTKWRWLVWTLWSPQTWVPMWVTVCSIQNSHGFNPGKDPRTMDGCFMWFDGHLAKNSQPIYYCKLVQETKTYGSWLSANKFTTKMEVCKLERFETSKTQFECGRTVSWV